MAGDAPPAIDPEIEEELVTLCIHGKAADVDGPRDAELVFRFDGGVPAAGEGSDHAAGDECCHDRDRDP